MLRQLHELESLRQDILSQSGGANQLEEANAALWQVLLRLQYNPSNRMSRREVLPDDFTPTLDQVRELVLVRGAQCIPRGRDPATPWNPTHDHNVCESMDQTLLQSVDRWGRTRDSNALERNRKEGVMLEYWSRMDTMKTEFGRDGYHEFAWYEESTEKQAQILVEIYELILLSHPSALSHRITLCGDWRKQFMGMSACILEAYYGVGGSRSRGRHSDWYWRGEVRLVPNYPVHAAIARLARFVVNLEQIIYQHAMQHQHATPSEISIPADVSAYASLVSLPAGLTRPPPASLSLTTQFQLHMLEVFKDALNRRDPDNEHNEYEYYEPLEPWLRKLHKEVMQMLAVFEDPHQQQQRLIGSSESPCTSLLSASEVVFAVHGQGIADGSITLSASTLVHRALVCFLRQKRLSDRQARALVVQGLLHHVSKFREIVRLANQHGTQPIEKPVFLPERGWYSPQVSSNQSAIKLVINVFTASSPVRLYLPVSDLMMVEKYPGELLFVLVQKKEKCMIRTLLRSHSLQAIIRNPLDSTTPLLYLLTHVRGCRHNIVSILLEAEERAVGIQSSRSAQSPQDEAKRARTLSSSSLDECVMRPTSKAEFTAAWSLPKNKHLRNAMSRPF